MNHLTISVMCSCLIAIGTSKVCDWVLIVKETGSIWIRFTFTIEKHTGSPEGLCCHVKEITLFHVIYIIHLLLITGIYPTTGMLGTCWLIKFVYKIEESGVTSYFLLFLY